MKLISSPDNPYSLYTSESLGLIISLFPTIIGRHQILSALPAFPPAASPIMVESNHCMSFEFKIWHKYSNLLPTIKCILSWIKTPPSTWANCFTAAILFHTIFGLENSSDILLTEDFFQPKIVYGQFQDGAEYSFAEPGILLSSTTFPTNSTILWPYA